MNLPRIRSGERHPLSKLTHEQIDAAARLMEEEDLTLDQTIQRLELRCSKWTLRRALKGQTYQDD